MYRMCISDSSVKVVGSRKNRIAKCPLCGREFDKMYKFYQHFKNHSRLEFKCEYKECGWMFQEFMDLEGHYMRKHGKFSRHEKTGPRIKPKCSICSRILKNWKILKEHVKNHKNMKYKCNVKECGWMFLEFPSLQTHLWTYHKKKARLGKDESKFITYQNEQVASLSYIETVAVTYNEQPTSIPRLQTNDEVNVEKETVITLQTSEATVHEKNEVLGAG